MLRTCPACDAPVPDPDARWCSECGVAVPAAVPAPRSGLDAERRSGGLAVGAALVGMALALALAVALVVLRSGSPSRAPLTAQVRPSVPRVVGKPQAPPQVHRAGLYQLPRSWWVARGRQPRHGYFETVVASPDGGARVTVDQIPGERTAPAVKAAEVESATRLTTPGYRRIAFAPTRVAGRPAFEWVFSVAGTQFDRRADLFVNTGTDGFAFLAHGTRLAGAVAAARQMAATLRAR